MHGQTEGTIGTGTVEEYFRFARDMAFMDVTSWQGNDFQVTDEEWKEVCYRTKEFYEPGRFVTFLGYEWSGNTPGGGDHNILYLRDDQPIYRCSHWQIHDGSSDETDRYPLSSVWEELRDRGDVMAIAHVGGRRANLDYWDKEISGLIEIHSHHGTFEWLVAEAFQRGLVVGFVAQSDDHTGRPGLSAPLRPLARDFSTFDVYGGYTGIYAEESTRECVWQALRARHCYATTGRRFFLDVRSGSSLMGDVISNEQPVDLSVRVASTAPLLDVEVRRDTEVIWRYPFQLIPDNAWVRIEWSGVRVKSRSKKADWDGVIRVENGTINDFRAYAFDQPDEGIVRQSDRTLQVTSTTSGDVDGVFLSISGTSPLVVFESDDISIKIPVKDLDQRPLIKYVGGVNLQLSFSKCTLADRPTDVAFDFPDSSPPKGSHAYWVRVVQIDGHMAWSSPIYFMKPLVTDPKNK
jgi:hypothetical protein